MRIPILLCLLLLVACGQSGELYLPDAKPPATNAPAVPGVNPPTAAEPKEQDEDEVKPNPVPVSP